MQKKKDKKKQLLKLSLLLFSFSAFRLYFAGYIYRCEQICTEYHTSVKW